MRLGSERADADELIERVVLALETGERSGISAGPGAGIDVSAGCVRAPRGHTAILMSPGTLRHQPIKKIMAPYTEGNPPKMFACLDVHYRDPGAVAACLTFDDWSAGEPLTELTESVANVAPYVSGEFYRRELPCLLQVLTRLEPLPKVLIIDGYVWLGDESRPGLGAFLHEALQRQIPIIGVAKTHLHGAGPAKPVLRGQSTLPLFVSAVGVELDEAAEAIRSMHGQYRLPTLLRKVDQLCRRAQFQALRGKAEIP